MFHIKTKKLKVQKRMLTNSTTFHVINVIIMILLFDIFDTSILYVFAVHSLLARKIKTLVSVNICVFFHTWKRLGAL